MSQKIYVREIPSNHTTMSFLRRHTPYQRACEQVPARRPIGDRLEMDISGFDTEKLRDSVLAIIREYGYSGWRHKDGESRTYGGFSLTYNPDHQDGLPPHISTLGTPKNKSDQFFWDVRQNHDALKHSYFDTYGFRRRTEASQIGELGRFLDSVERPIIRSRVGIIPGENVDSGDPVYRESEGWHRDEPVFENLRINIPLQTDENFVFQMEGGEPYHLPVGTAYSWDTHRPHRVFCCGPTRTMRIHIVLGVAPWFDYFEDEDAWAPNEFFGKMHPFDMLSRGLISKHVKLRQPASVTEAATAAHAVQ